MKALISSRPNLRKILGHSLVIVVSSYLQSTTVFRHEKKLIPDPTFQVLFGRHLEAHARPLHPSELIGDSRHEGRFGPPAETAVKVSAPSHRRRRRNVFQLRGLDAVQRRRQHRGRQTDQVTKREGETDALRSPGCDIDSRKMVTETQGEHARRQNFPLTYSDNSGNWSTSRYCSYLLPRQDEDDRTS